MTTNSTKQMLLSATLGLLFGAAFSEQNNLRGIQSSASDPFHNHTETRNLQASKRCRVVLPKKVGERLGPYSLSTERWPTHYATMQGGMEGYLQSTAENRLDSKALWCLTKRTDGSYLISNDKWPDWYAYMRNVKEAWVRGWYGDPGPQGHWIIEPASRNSKTVHLAPTKWPDWLMGMQDVKEGWIQGWKGTDDQARWHLCALFQADLEGFYEKSNTNSEYTEENSFVMSSSSSYTETKELQAHMEYTLTTSVNAGLESGAISVGASTSSSLKLGLSGTLSKTMTESTGKNIGKTTKTTCTFDPENCRAAVQALHPDLNVDTAGLQIYHWVVRMTDFEGSIGTSKTCRYLCGTLSIAPQCPIDACMDLTCQTCCVVGGEMAPASECR